MKYIILFFSLSLSVIPQLSAQFLTTGDGAKLYTTKNVGIGTSNPSFELDIVGRLRLSTSETISPLLLMAYDDTNKFQLGYNSINDLFRIDSRNNAGSWSTRFAINKETGYVGIGTTSPSEKLHIDNGALQFLNLGESTDNVDIIKISESATSNEFTLQGMFAGTGQAGNTMKFRSMWKDNLLVIRGNGEIGIGTYETGGHKLAVDGSIGAREIKVETTTWSDFVFDNNYNLRTLNEVENYISKNKHLPEIPSETEVIENGINLGEMNAKLLQKVEELTLYLIEQNKQLNKANQNITELQKEVSAMKSK